MLSSTEPPFGSRARPALLLFGPQQSTIRLDEFKTLVSTITTTPDLTFLLDAVTGLEEIWADIVNACPELTIIPGQETLHQLALYVTGRSEPGDWKENVTGCITLNIITVLSQVVELWKFETATGGVHSTPAGAGVKDIQGFCIGFLTAAAVASYRTQETLERNIAAALRLAVCVGALVELDSMVNSPGVSVSASWRTPAQYQELNRIVTEKPSGYIACVTDQTRVTITLRDQDLVNTLEQLSNAGIACQEIALKGCFHNRDIHSSALRRLQQLCQRDERFQLPNADELVFPLRSNINGDLVAEGSLHDEALQSILLHPCQWYKTVQAAVVASAVDPESIISIGPEMAIPRSVKKPQQVDINGGHSETSKDIQPADSTPAIAIIGMATRYPDSDTLEEFWDLLQSGRSAVQPLPEARFKASQIPREPKGPFWGNFLRDPDRFDHRFFGISGREAKSMDPQQRLALEVAYEALESAGYFGLRTGSAPITDVGCYLGVGSVDYGDNVASHDANAFSALGTLRAFISGRLSHFFGWSGPSITFDTACSSGLVAIHSAVNALKANECSMALAGGVNVITSPALYQNLAAASFLSPTGASRAFDERADGYCRGEGVGLLVLKTLDRAQADGDDILAVIRGSAVMQGSNCSPITVPSSDTQSALYRKALAMSGIEPQDVTYIEAHGTGTPVGDPIECESIRAVFGSPRRRNNVLVGSVKDNVGHTEAASGATALIKTVIMMQKQTIPRQANFTRLNPRIAPLTPDGLDIAQRTQPWGVSRRVAVVNNYGAAGSNAAMVVEEYPKRHPAITASSAVSSSSWPFFLAAKSLESLREYCASMALSLRRLRESNPHATIADLAYNLAVKQNRGFEFVHTFVASSMDELASSLDPARIDNRGSKMQRPVVLCLGGQNGTTVHIDPDLYYNCPLLRSHLDACDRTCIELGLPSIFPSVLRAEPIQDLVALHCALFSTQYATAKAWLDSGLKVDSIIGHSFGQLTALAIADAVSLSDGLRLVSGRARLIQAEWGDEKGAMISVQASLRTVNRLLEDTARVQPDFIVDVACVNGADALVLAGRTSSVSILEETFQSQGLKTTRLPNTHAFHSRLVEPILPRWREIVRSCDLKKPSIAIAPCAEGQDWSSSVLHEEVVQHSRQPVYFHDTVRRLAARWKDCVWVEAGSASPVISLIRKSLHTDSSNHVFQPVDLRGPDALSSLSRAICNLWAAGTRVQHWCFQQGEYTWINLPPYSFQKTSHWLDYVPVPGATTKAANGGAMTPPAERAQELLEILETGAQGTTFRVSASHPVFTHCTKGHAVLGQPLCPASLYVELATQAAGKLQPLQAQSSAGLSVRGLKISSPLPMDGHQEIFLRLRPDTHEQNTWTFTVLSRRAEQGNSATHTTGVISLDSGNHLLSAARMKSLRRLVGPVREAQLASSPEANVITSKDNESVGLVGLEYGQTPGLAPTSVAGIHVNCLSDRGEDAVYICTDLGELTFSDSFASRWCEVPQWKVYSTFEPETDKTSGDLMVMFIGAIFHSTPMKSLARVLEKLNITTVQRPDSAPNGLVKVYTPGPSVSSAASTVSSSSGAEQANGLPSATLDTTVPVADISPDAALVDIGIDSLLSTEILNEIKSHFGVTIPASTFSSLDTVISLAQYLNPNTASDLPKSRMSQTPPAVNGTSKTVPILSQVQEMFSDVLGLEMREITAESTLSGIGVDSLLATEVLNEIRTRFAVTISSDKFQKIEDIRTLAAHLEQAVSGPTPSASVQQSIDEPPPNVRSLGPVAQESFAAVRQTVDDVLPLTQFAGFCASVLPLQKELVVAYIVEAFESLKCSLSKLNPGQRVPDLRLLPQHRRLKSQIYHILEDAALIQADSADASFVRTSTDVPRTRSEELHAALLSRFPQHAYEHRLLASTGSKLAACLVGDADPLGILFGSADARTLMEQVYTDAPMFKTGTIQLARYLADMFTRSANSGSSSPIKILELGAGTGGTTKYLIEHLLRASTAQEFQYTFSDISPSLVAAARKKFAQYSFMQYTLVNIEQEPPADLLGQYDIIISTNCIHATRDLVSSCTHIRKLLRPDDGVVCLVELTRNLFWFDLVFGLLDGWWRFEDGRQHALANEHIWRKTLTRAGFRWVDWTVGASEESDILRVITASVSARQPLHSPQMETIEFDRVDGVSLQADIYYPSRTEKALPVALMIHGGGHIMLSRKDIRPKQVEMLLDRGFLPISIDYRLCPETTLLDGPMHDVCTALSWIRAVLPTLPLQRPDIRIDPTHVAAVGWSTGGHLALTLGFTAAKRGIRPPDAILAFYCPLDYEDPFWTQPNFPFGQRPDTHHDITLEDLREEALHTSPIVAYNPAAASRPLGGWMAPSDARSRLALWMNWTGRTVHVLLNGLSGGKPLPNSTANHTNNTDTNDDNTHNTHDRQNGATDNENPPPLPQIQSISPLAQIRTGAYRTPTFLIHGTEDDLIPVDQAVRTHNALRERGVTSEARILEGAVHLFDLFRGFEHDVEAGRAVRDGYDFLKRECCA
ncbi:hypothetical protein BJX61DRAFT_549115 [Aspergillus egyptiacus]|nr:hypothetical protein BJX61DRAFT_549115 [Aspergillus egyptiacus]